jgi:hypothetical protein
LDSVILHKNSYITHSICFEDVQTALVAGCLQTRLPGIRASSINKGSEAFKSKASADGNGLEHSSRDLGRSKALRSIKTKDSILDSAASYSSGNPNHVAAAADAASFSAFSVSESSRYRSPQRVKHLHKSVQQLQEDLLFADTFGIPVTNDQTSWPGPDTPTNASVQDSLAATRAHVRRISGQRESSHAEPGLQEQQQLDAGLSPAAKARAQRPFLHLDPSK